MSPIISFKLGKTGFPAGARGVDEHVHGVLSALWRRAGCGVAEQSSVGRRRARPRTASCQASVVAILGVITRGPTTVEVAGD